MGNDDLESANTGNLAEKTPTLRNTNERPLLETGFWDDQAGIVLLWPYLETLFERLDLLNGETFRSPANALEAVNLCSYLTTGQARPPDESSPVAMYLCGLPLSSPFTPHTPDAGAIALCDGLLDAAKQHWQAMADVSHESLRQTFLHRQGHLRLSENNDWGEVTLEAKPYDLLLQSLPWSLSQISFPWMNGILKVNWK